MKTFAYISVTILLIGFCIVGCSQDSGKSVDELNAEATKLLQSGQKDQALEKAMAALKKSEKENGANQPDTVMSLEIMGAWCIRQRVIRETRNLSFLEPYPLLRSLLVRIPGKQPKL